MASFMELSCELMETMDWSVIFDGPDAWTGSLGRACLMRVRSHLNIEAGMAGVELDDRCEGHFCVDEKEGVFAIALRHGDSWYGPAEAPGLFASYGMDEITEWMAEACKCGLIEHPDAKSLQALVRAYRHHYN
jgi:hypothetical protein